MRIDKFLYERGFAKSRAAAKRLIDSGSVKICGSVVTKASLDVTDDCHIDVEDYYEKYVSRGGFKLEAAINAFKIDVSGLDCIDIGASTGGFTDCLLQQGAKFVRAVDVGRAQLDIKIAGDSRVRSFEGVNARYITDYNIGEACELAVCDVSFISLTLLFPAIRKIIKPYGKFVGLIKPQFEAGRAAIGKNGIVKKRDIHIDVIKNVLNEAKANGLFCSGLIPSPILGGDGNREYLAVFDSTGGFDESKILEVVYKE